jgi:hypothetical protein
MSAAELMELKPAGLQGTAVAIIGGRVWRTKIMRGKSAVRIFFSLMALCYPSVSAGAQTSSKVNTTSANGESSTESNEQQEMREELKALRAELDRLRAEVEQHEGAASAGNRGEPQTLKTGGPSLAPATAANFSNPPAVVGSGQQAVGAASSVAPSDPFPTKKPKIDPFSDWDWSWLNGNPPTKEAAFDSMFFTPEIRADIDYVYDFNKPQDNSMGGSSELFHSNEILLEQLGVGGDFHFNNVRARFMTQFGMYSTPTPRNDPSPAKGQWDLRDAYRYVSEAYGGYPINALNGINIDAGIFMSYIGLFSDYNFDNWAYQSSYVSSNPPWFFNG